MTWNTVYSQALTSNSGGWQIFTIRQRIAVAAYSVLPASSYELRVTLTAATAGFPVVWYKMYIGHRNMVGDTLDFDGTQVPLLFSGSTSGTLAVGGTVVSDPVLYSFDKTRDLIVTVYFQGGNSDIRALIPAAADFTGGYIGSDHSSDTDVSMGSYDVASRLYLFSKVEASDVDPPPTVTINKSSSQDDPTTSNSIVFTAVFDKPVTGFTGTDIDFTGSTVTGTLAAAISGSGATYSVTVTGMASAGNVVASIPAGRVIDGSGNGNLASTSTDNTVAFSPAPKLTVTELTMVKPNLLRIQVNDDPVVHGYTEVLGAADSVGGADIYTVTGTANNGFGAIRLTTSYASTVTALTILNLAASPVANGSGGQRIRVTVYDTASISTWSTAQIYHCKGTTEANSKLMSWSSTDDRIYWSIIIIDGTHFDLKYRVTPSGTEDLSQPATFTNAYTGNGVVMDSGDSMSHPFVVSRVVGTTEANRAWWPSRSGTSTVDLLDSTFTNAYVSGGQVIPCGFGVKTPFYVRTNPTTGLPDYCYIVGQQSNQRRFIDQRGANYLDRDAALDVSKYGSIGGRAVTAAYLKSTPYMGGIGKFTGGGAAMMPAVSFRHYIYLQLSGNLTNGSYTVDFPFTANITDYPFAFDDKVTRCCAIRVDQVGHRPADPGKRAYLAEWTPGITQYGELSFPEVTTWHVINSSGAIVWTAPAAPALRGTGSSVEGLSLGFANSNSHYNILQSYPLKVTGITNANPAKVTLVDASSISNGDTVSFSGLFHYPLPGPGGDSGMWQLEEQFSIVSNKLGNTFDINVDTSNAVGLPHYSTFATSATGDQGNLCFKVNTLSNRSGTYVYGLDYAAATLTTGTYYIYIPGFGVSDPINISESKWYEVAQVYAEGMYHERSGCLLDGRFGYTRPVTMRNRAEQPIFKSYMPYAFVSYNNLGIASLDIGVNNNSKGGGFGNFLFPAKDTINGGGGHMDAGDWDTRFYECAPGYYHNLDVFDHLPSAARALLDHNLPTCLEIGLDPVIFAGTDALPSPLVEVIWGMEFARASQEANGAIWGGMNYGEGVPDYQCSWNTAYPIWAYYPDHLCTYLFAGVAAKLGKILATLGYASLATHYKDKAALAFSWAETIYDRGSAVARDAWYLPIKTAAGWSASDYSSAITASRTFDGSPRAFGAACLFAATGTAAYKTICDAMLPIGSSAPRESDPMWEYCNAAGATPAIVTTIRNQLASWGLNSFVAPAEAPDIHFTSVQQIGFYYGGYGAWNDWGGPSPALIRAAIIYSTIGDPLFDTTKASRCRRALQTMMQHRHGANQTGFCWTNGIGARNIKEATHLDSRYFGQDTPSGIGPEGPSELFPFPMPLIFGTSNISRIQHPQWDPNTVATDPNSFYREMRPYNQKCWPRWEMLIEYNTAIVQMEFTTQQQIIPAYPAAMYLHAFDGNLDIGTTLAPSTAALVSSLNPSPYAVSVTFTCTVTGGFGTPTGTVTFRDGGVSFGVIALNGAGVAAISTSALSPGVRTITATYNGDSVYDTDADQLFQSVTAVANPLRYVSFNM